MKGNGGKQTAKKVGEGDQGKKQRPAPQKPTPKAVTIPARPCLMKWHVVWTATPYSKTHDGHFLCCKECSDAYYAIPNHLGVWGRPISTLIHTVAELNNMKSPEVKPPPVLRVV